MFSQTVEYALRAGVVLASDPDRSWKVREIAEAGCAPVHYLSKILQALARAGLVRSQRGLHGGYALARSPDDVSVYDLVSAIEPIPRLKRCPLGLAEHDSGLCPLHLRLDEAAERMEASLRATTLAELLRKPGPGSPLCLRAEPKTRAPG
ncbi:MAG TPA: Rrf2 family transcriptional regulator [Chthonomonadales bacterium]|nr:Rrf2 family transcriptional regulator [Chthonomonadales bacterium]